MIHFIKLACYDHDGKVSSSRISSFFLLVTIILTNISFIIIDCINAYFAIKAGREIPQFNFALYSATLTHHLALLGINAFTQKKGNDFTIKTEVPQNK